MTLLRAVAASTVAIALAIVTPQAQVSNSPFDRAAAVRLLERMIATGFPAETDHDEGEWLQAAVTDLIGRGDREVERLALRAAAPLRVMVSTPVSSITSPPSLMVAAADVLNAPTRIPYTAKIFLSLDGGDLVEVWTQASGKGGGVRLDTRLGKVAVRPGGHHLRVRAELTFGGGNTPSWTEVRDLPELFYAIYDLSQNTVADGRRLLFGPAAFTAASFDPALPEQPIEAWFVELLAPYRRPDRSWFAWMSHYCDLRTADPKGAIDPNNVCAVLYFDTAASGGQLWFRTAEVQVLDDRLSWVPLPVPRFEGMVYGDRNADRLSALGELLQTIPGDQSGGDAGIEPADIEPADIELTPAVVRTGAPADVAVTVRNRGRDWIHKALVTLMWGSDHRTVQRRRFTVDIPPSGTAVVRTMVTLPASYGFIIADVFQRTEHSPALGYGMDLTHEDFCAVRVVNAAAAPPALLEEIRRAGPCRVLFR